MATIKNCTLASPMPMPEKGSEKWYHHGAKPTFKNSLDYKCPNCGIEFKVTIKPAISVKEAIEKIKKMKEQGVDFNA